MAQTSATILIIDDEEIIREALEALLTAEGYTVLTAPTAGQGLDVVSERHVDAVLLDLMLPDRNGLEVLPEIRRIDEELPVVMITAFGTIESAISATKQVGLSSSIPIGDSSTKSLSKPASAKPTPRKSFRKPPSQWPKKCPASATIPPAANSKVGFSKLPVAASPTNSASKCRPMAPPAKYRSNA